MRIYKTRDGWCWTEKIREGIIGNYYNQSRSFIGCIFDYISWVISMLMEN